MYQIGEYVVYRQLYVCKIENVETPTFERNAKKLYYKISPVFDNKNNTTVYVPTDAAECLRKVASKEDVESALKTLPTLKVVVATFKKPQQLAAYYQEALLTGDIKRYLSIIKEIVLKERTNPKKLSEIDSRFKNRAERIIYEELAVVLRRTPETVKKDIEKIL